jgi:metal-dependent HD superfamily phosphatase/phosphodiesterase
MANQVKIKVPTEGNQLLEKALKVINESEEVAGLWRVVNVNAMDRLGMTDHGSVHFKIVANMALKITRLLVENQVELSITRDFGLSEQHGELVVLLASLFHDLGMSINRAGHEDFSLFLANNLMREMLTWLPVEERTIVISETLHAIIAHRSDGRPQTIEAGIVRVADALDMSEGRSRIPYQAGKVDIHSVSAAAIDEVRIGPGETKPIGVEILMNNSSGVFQVDELLKKKLAGSGIEEFVSVKARIDRGEEKSLVKEFKIS